MPAAASASDPQTPSVYPVPIPGKSSSGVNVSTTVVLGTMLKMMNVQVFVRLYTVKLTYNEHGYCEFTFITKFF